MAITPPPFPSIPAVSGFRLATAATGLKQSGADDLLLVEMSPCQIAAVFTQNQIVAAPVTLSRQRLPGGIARALLVNSGNANAVTGQQGMQDALSLSAQAAKQLNITEEQVFVASTGIIGEPLATDILQQAIPNLAEQLAPGGWQEAATAIMTTDTFAKGGSETFQQNGHKSRIVGISKGAGMIHPNMATLLAFLFTDAAITASALQTLLHRAMEESFHAISVDGDTSTNDTVMAFASGLCGAPRLEDPNHPDAQPLANALNRLCQSLAQTIVRDGEGASKFLQISVENARNEEEAKQVAFAVAKSPLVKTACAGHDPNWGRILAAVGYAGVKLDPERIHVFLNELLVVEHGGRAAQYRTEEGEKIMQQEEITIRIDLGLGQTAKRVWSCDLTHDYIRINADYHT